MRTIIECLTVYGALGYLLYWVLTTPYEEPLGWKELRRLGLEHTFRW